MMENPGLKLDDSQLRFNYVPDTPTTPMRPIVKYDLDGSLDYVDSPMGTNVRIDTDDEENDDEDFYSNDSEDEMEEEVSKSKLPQKHVITSPFSKVRMDKKFLKREIKNLEQIRKHQKKKLQFLSEKLTENDYNHDEHDDSSYDSPSSSDTEKDEYGLLNRTFYDKETNIMTIQPLEMDAVAEDYDYYEDPRNKKYKKKTKFTIPNPYSFMNRSPKNKISEKKFEDYMKKKREEEEHVLNYKFVAKPVPYSSKVSLYEEILDNREIRRREILTSSRRWLIDNEKPFSFWKRNYHIEKERKMKKLKRKFDKTKKYLDYRFISNPVPDSSMYDKRRKRVIKEKERRRKERIKERAEEMYNNSHLPPRMEMWKEEESVREKIYGKNKKKMGKEYTFKPKINEKIPNFVALQREFERELNDKKRKMKETNPKVFNLSKQRPNKIQRVLDDIENDKNTLRERRWPYVSKRKKMGIKEIPNFNKKTGFKMPDLTITDELRNRKNREKILNMKIEDEKKKIEKMKFFNTRAFMAKPMKMTSKKNKKNDFTTKFKI